MNVTPCAVMPRLSDAPTRRGQSDSGRPWRTSTVTLLPIAAQKLANSNPTAPDPMTMTERGMTGSSNAASESSTRPPKGASASGRGVAPVAITT